MTGANTVIAGGIFGDILIRNTKRIIKVSGLYAQSFSDWGVIESNLRNIVPKGLDNQNFGSNAIRNKTPSIAPIGINSFTGLNAAIGLIKAPVADPGPMLVRVVPDDPAGAPSST